MNTENALKRLRKVQEKRYALIHAIELINYDAVTGAPSGTCENRQRTLGVLSEELYKLGTCKRTVGLLEFLDENRDGLSEENRREVFLLLKDIRDMQKIPMNEYLEYQALLVDAVDVWHNAKEKSDFALFEPYLEKIFETNIRFAGYLAPDKDPYDYWLNEYEEGLSKDICDKFFEKVRKRLVPLIEKTKKCPPVDMSVLSGDFPVEKQRELSYYLMKLIGLDLAHVGLSDTEHPFTTSLGSHLDERITTHYYTDDFSSSMFSVIHEGGHALYDTGSRSEFSFTELDGGVSMGIHESQSRFYENILGRSFEFIKYIYPKLSELFPSLAKYSPGDLYRAVNRVEPSLIRTEADEVTYCLHVMVRYEIEKEVMSGKLKVHDIPDMWNRLYKEYLGVDVPDDKRGALQDSHWSGGAVGYFPSYALGSAYGAQFLVKMSEEVDIPACLAAGDFTKINEWNRQNIWQYGSLYTPGQLLKKILKGDFDPDCYLDYLENKVRDVYGV